LLDGIAASDTFAYMQAKIVRETVLKTAAQGAGTPADRAGWRAEALQLRQPDRAGHGIGQLQAAGAAQRAAGEAAAERGERYELGETLLQMAIVLLSIAMVAGSAAIAGGAALVAVGGILLAIATHFGLAL
jgi:hypothetical protein